MTTTVKGVLLEHDGSDYLVTVDTSGHPDLLRRVPTGWESLKEKRRAKDVGNAMLADLHEQVGYDHTQQVLKALVLRASSEVLRAFFAHARW